MSMELAILELAAGMKELAAAVRGVSGGWSPVVLTAGHGEKIKGTFTHPAEVDPTDPRDDILTVSVPVEEKATELAAARTERVAESKVSEKVDAAQNVKAKQDAAEQKAKQDAATEVKPDAELEAAAAPLNYKDDVLPKLMLVVKAKGRAGLIDLLAKFGVDKGDKLSEDQFAAVVAEAIKLVA